MDAISVMICKTDNFFNNRLIYDEDIDYLRFKQPYIAIIIYKSSNNKMVLSLRKLMDIQQLELFELPLDIDCSSNLSQPYILTKQNINELNEGIKTDSDLLIIGYYDKEQKVKVISISNENMTDKHQNFQAELTDPNDQELKIYLDNYPKSFEEVKKAKDKTKAEISLSLLNYFKQDQVQDHFQYYICSTDEHDRRFMVTQNNQNVKQYVKDIIIKQIEQSKKSDENHDGDLNVPSKTIVVTDYVNMKIMVLYSSDQAFQPSYGTSMKMANTFMVIEVEMAKEGEILRYNEGSFILKDQNIEEQNMAGAKSLKHNIQQLFESPNEYDPQTFMASYEFKNIIRDNTQVICFLDNQNNEGMNSKSIIKSSVDDSHSKQSSDSEKTESSESTNDIPSIMCIQDPTH